MDLLKEVFFAPWNEIEVRIAQNGWKDFPKVEPHHLGTAKKQLTNEGLIFPDETDHPNPVVGYRLEFEEGKAKEQERLRGEKRKLYRKYLAWTGDVQLCGKHAERVTFDSIQAAATAAGLYVPPQAPGSVAEIEGHAIRSGPIDLWAYIMDLDQVRPVSEMPMVIEVKNIHSWIYPSERELWEFLVKAAELAQHILVVPVMVCYRYHYTTGQMAKDIGVLFCEMWSQLFSEKIGESEFDQVTSTFGLAIRRHDGAFDPIVRFLATRLRASPPPSPPPESIPWYRRQAHRFQTIAPTVLNHHALAETLDAEARGRVFGSFRSSSRDVTSWPLTGGW